MSVLFARGAVDQALQAGRLALARNPYDPDIMASLGSRYILLNRPAEGLPLVEKAIALSTGRPPFYDFYAVLGAYLLGAPQVSRGHALFLGVGANSFSLLGHAIRAVRQHRVRPDRPAKGANGDRRGRCGSRERGRSGVGG
jgi:hypothetical protein